MLAMRNGLMFMGRTIVKGIRHDTAKVKIELYAVGNNLRLACYRRISIADIWDG